MTSTYAGERTEKAIKERVRNELAGTIAKDPQASQNTPRHISIPEFTGETHDTVHIVQSYCRKGYAMGAWPTIRSVLFHRSTKVHFHLIADEDAMPEDVSLFEEVVKQFSNVKVSYAADSARWLTKAAGFQAQNDFKTQLPPCSLVRMWTADIFPDLDAAIVLDTNDVVVLADIGELWSMFSEFEKDELIGASLEQTPHYNKFLQPTHPAYDARWKGVVDDHGFNCGVLLMNLTKLRAWNWAGKTGIVAVEAKVKGLKTFGSLAENDMWNYQAMKTPEILHKLPCNFNVILYGGGWGLWSQQTNRLNENGCAATPIKIMQGTGRSFKHHELGLFESFFKDHREAVFSAGDGFLSRSLAMAPTMYYNSLPTAKDKYRSKHDRWATPSAPRTDEEVHIAISICDVDIRKLTAFFKSLLFHRSTPLHIYFIADVSNTARIRAKWEELEAGTPFVGLQLSYVHLEEHAYKYEKTVLNSRVRLASETAQHWSGFNRVRARNIFCAADCSL